MTISNTKKYILGIEARFKKVAELDVDLSKYPLKSNEISQVKTDFTKSKKFSEVFTPLWLVDAMINQVKFKSPNYRTLDLAAGYGQFSVRLMRYFYNKYNSQFDVDSFLKNHSCAELQLSSCYKLLYVFGTRLNLFIGDATYLSKLPESATGIWCYIESFGGWVCLTKTIKNIFMPSPRKVIAEEEFVNRVEKLITYLNETHKEMTTLYKKVGYNKSTRLGFLKLIKEKMSSLFVQTNETPEVLVKEMIDQIDDLEHKSILVLYNAEFVEQLVHDKKVDPSDITFACEWSELAKVVNKLYGVECKVINGKNSSFWKKQLGSKKYDVCLSNPPYNDGLDLKILMSLISSATEKTSIATEYVWVHPSTWLMDQKDSKDLYVNMKSILSDKIKSINLFNGNTIFGISIHVPCEIIHIDVRMNTQSIKVNLMGDKFDATSLAEVTKFGSNWQSIVLPFKKLAQKLCDSYGNVWEHVEKNIDSNKVYYQCAGVRGHEDYTPKSMVKDDFYTISPKDININKGIRKPLSRGNDNMPAFGFSSEKERDNFLHYLNTDFARFCLAILKNNQNIHRGEMALIPWLDFTQSWDDEKLFNHFNIDQKTQDYIRSFLPDYYGIRKPARVTTDGTAQATP